MENPGSTPILAHRSIKKPRKPRPRRRHTIRSPLMLVYDQKERQPDHPIMAKMKDKLGIECAAACISLAYSNTGFRHSKGITEKYIDVVIRKYYEKGTVPWVVFLHYAKLFPEIRWETKK